MDNLLLGLLVVLVLVLLAAVLVVLLLLLRRPAQETQSAVMLEKLSRLDPITKAVSSIQLGLTELQAYAKARQDVEQRTAESVRRLEAVIAGTQTKGAAGENILEFMFAKLPVEWQVRGFRVGNKTVEFALRLPNGRVLPIDSKWAATNLLEQFSNSDDPEEQQKLKAQIERTVLSKAGEVSKYLEPTELTVNFGIAAVPDAVYDLCSGIHAKAFEINVVVVSYSMFLPYLLLVFQTVLRTSQNIDLEKLNACLQTAQDGVIALQKELEGRLSDAINKLTRSRDELRRQVGKVSSGLISLQIGTGTPGPLAALAEPQPGEQDVLQD